MTARAQELTIRTMDDRDSEPVDQVDGKNLVLVKSSAYLSRCLVAQL